MTGWEVQAMWEADAAAEWERINAPDPYEQAMAEAAASMKKAAEHLDKAIDYLLDAQSILSDTPMERAITSLLEQVEDIKCDVDMLKSRYERGLRE